jgi:hypothetical protein
MKLITFTVIFLKKDEHYNDIIQGKGGQAG